MTSIAVSNPHETDGLNDIADMKNWQRHEFGQDIIDVLKKTRKR
jgi:hypothetical protein